MKRAKLVSLSCILVVISQMTGSHEKGVGATEAMHEFRHLISAFGRSAEVIVNRAANLKRLPAESVSAPALKCTFNVGREARRGGFIRGEAPRSNASHPFASDLCDLHGFMG